MCALTHAAVHHYGWVNGSFSCALWLFIEWIMAFDCVNCGSLLCGSWLFIVWIMALLMCVRYYSNTATRSDTLQQTTTHCTTLQHTVTHGIAMQCTATHCNTLQHTTQECNIEGAGHLRILLQMRTGPSLSPSRSLCVTRNTLNISLEN